MKKVLLVVTVLTVFVLSACTGESGINGIDGVDGTNGINGIDGVDGQDGKDGVDGLNGLDGVNGINGIDGKDGVDGVNGLDGKDGVDGVDGKDGIDGIDGKDGLDGKDGEKGEKGDRGYTGATGPRGIQGPQGEIGPQGIQGEKGDKGDTGEQGPQGIAGTNGLDGETGAVGPQGPQGEQGIQGETGTVDTAIVDELQEQIDLLTAILIASGHIVTVDNVTELDMALNDTNVVLIYLNAGTYTLTNTYTLDRELVIKGNGSTVNLPAGPQAITITGDVTFEDFTLQAGEDTTKMVYVDNGSLVLNDMTVIGSGTVALGDANYGATQIYANNESSLEVYDSTFSDYGRVAIYVKNGSVGIIDNNIFYAQVQADDELQYSVMGYYGADITVTNNEFNFTIAAGVTERDDWGSYSVSLGGIYEITLDKPISFGTITGNTFTGEGSAVSYSVYANVTTDVVNAAIEGYVADDNTWLTYEDIQDYTVEVLDTLYVDGTLTISHADYDSFASVVIISGEVVYSD